MNETRHSGNSKSQQKYMPGEITVEITVRLRARISYLERAIRHLCPLELSCDITALTQEHTMNSESEEFRPRRNASEITRVRINELANDDREGPFYD